MRLARDAEGLVIVDARGTMPGRGAWLCADPVCVERGLRRDRLSHAFRKACRVPPDLDAAVLEAARACNAEARGPVK